MWGGGPGRGRLHSSRLTLNGSGGWEKWLDLGHTFKVNQ